VNESILPFNAVDVPLGQFLHRVGAILHVTNEISLYALNATSFTPPTNGAVLESGQLPPPQAGKSNEVGIKTALLGGKISGEFAYFHMVLQNQVDIVGGFYPNGQTFSTLIGSTNQEGVDGDLALTVVPGWQLVGAFYVGHDRNYQDQPVDTSYDNSWSLYNRYNFSRGTPLSGIAIGGGVTRVGGRWMDSGGLVDSSYNVPALLKMQTGTLINLFIEYQPNRHWSFRLRCDNALDQAYPLAAQGAEFVDAVPPRNFTFETDFKF
jgi:iron complex outermembrane receptor protein